MNHSIKKINQCVADITITIPAEELTKDYKEVLNYFKNYAAIPGFRPGKAPLQMIEKKYEDKIREMFLEKKLPEYYAAVIKEADLHLVAEGNFLDIKWEKGEDLTAVVRVELAPEIKIEKYSELTIPYLHKEINDEIVENGIKMMLEQMAVEEEIEDGEARIGDTLEINLTEIDMEDEKDMEELVSTVTYLKLQFDGEEEKNKKLMEALVGKKKGEHVKTTAVIESGKEYSVTLEIEKILRTEIPVLNDEFVKEEGFESVAKFKQSIKKDMEQETLRKNQESKTNALIYAILEANPFDLPPTQLFDYTRQIVEPYANAVKQPVEEMIKEYLPMAAFDMKKYYLINELKKIIEIEVTEEDKSAMINELAEEINMTQEEYKEKNADVTKSDRFVNRITEKKLFEKLFELNNFEQKSTPEEVRATVTEKESNEEEISQETDNKE